MPYAQLPRSNLFFSTDLDTCRPVYPLKSTSTSVLDDFDECKNETCPIYKLDTVINELKLQNINYCMNMLKRMTLGKFGGFIHNCIQQFKT